ncbi:hypothetical protein EMCRGX_G005789 [Ephydatia muelleri]
MKLNSVNKPVLSFNPLIGINSSPSRPWWEMMTQTNLSVLLTALTSRALWQASVFTRARKVSRITFQRKQKIGQTYWWKGLNRDLDQYCRRCDVCQRVNAKVERKKDELHPIPVPSNVWTQIGIDLIGPLPETCRKNKYIVTVTDYFSKWPEGAPLKDKTAVLLISYLQCFVVMAGLTSYFQAVCLS